MKALLVLVLVAVISVHLHLLYSAREGSSANTAVSVEARPIVLEEATLRALVRDEVERALGPSGVTMPDLMAIRESVAGAVHEGLNAAQIRESIAHEYVSGYYDAVAEIDGAEAVRAQTERNIQAIRTNLRYIASAAQQFMLDEGVSEVWYENIVGPNSYIDRLQSVTGEDYRGAFPVTAETRRLSVRMRDGTLVEYAF